MTKIKAKERLTDTAYFKGIVQVALLCFVIFFGFNLSDKIKDGVISGMKFAVFTVIPTGYPFMILGDLYKSYGRPEKIPLLSFTVTRLFKISENGLTALICGTLAGFPLGAKMASELYTGGCISKKEAEKIASVSNLPSIPFVISAVGSAMLGDIKAGVFLLIIVYISALFTARIYSRQKDCTRTQTEGEHTLFSFTDSVKNSAISSIHIIAFISIFFAISKAVSMFIGSSVALAVVSSFLEVATATSFTASLSLPYSAKLMICSFALSFGGLSVMMQSSIFLKKASLSMSAYFRIKLTQGIVSILLSALFVPFLI